MTFMLDYNVTVLFFLMGAYNTVAIVICHHETRFSPQDGKAEKQSLKSRSPSLCLYNDIGIVNTFIKNGKLAKYLLPRISTASKSCR